MMSNWLKRSGRVVLTGVAAVAIGGALAPAAMASPSAPSVSVTPNNDLTDGAVVTVSSSGFAANAQAAAVECATPSGGTELCDLEHAAVYQSNAKGDGTTPFTVHRQWTGTDPLTGKVVGPVDCATVASGCVVGVTDANRQTATAQIAFRKTATTTIASH
ncbi:enediyne antibiotic chromoprotein [Amycolatopsis samaneae]|uniref:Enediyne antibiotic chromoprotein n=1 Tax=Amycolatopsis samaneae TaxID=664691 RepID=A0ABW5GGC7_9PSEU